MNRANRTQTKRSVAPRTYLPQKRGVRCPLDPGAAKEPNRSRCPAWLCRFRGHLGCAGVNRRWGGVTVEFSLVAAIAFLLIFASIELARINVIRHTADNAAYEAARRSIVPNATTQDAIDRAQLIMQAVGARGTQVTTNPAVITNNTEQVTVTVNVPLDANGWVTARFSRGRLIVRQCTMAREEFQ